ncbi:Helix-turn-helix type 11 domain protein (fragment) [Sinorhizobium medicae]
MRQDIRNFRADRVEHCEPLDIYFQGQGERLRQLWVAGWRADVGRPLATADG